MIIKKFYHFKLEVFMEKIIEQIKDIFLSPGTFWDEAKAEQISTSDLVKKYFIFIAAVPTVAGFFGALFIGDNFFRALIWAVLFYGCAIAGVYLVSKVMMFLAQSFNAKKDELAIFKLVAYSFTPILLAGIFFLIPPIYWLAIIGLYGFYFFWIGFQKIVECPQDEKFNFSFISLIILIITTMLVYLLPALISGSSVYYYII